MKRMQILGATTRAKRSNAGWGSTPSALFLTMEGGVAKVVVKVFDTEENFNKDHEEGHAEIRLKEDEALQLIRGLAKIYNINLQVKGES